MGRPALRLSREAKEALLAHRYPGNVRELKNAMERASALCSGDTLGVDDLPPELRGSADVPGTVRTLRGEKGSLLAERMDDREAELIAQALAAAGDSRTEAARLLGISRKTLWKKMKRYC